MFADSVRIPLQEDVMLDNVWHTTVWAGNAGWHTLHTDNTAPLPYYVCNHEEWLSLATTNQMNATSRAANKADSRISDRDDGAKRDTTNLFLYPFYTGYGIFVVVT